MGRELRDIAVVGPDDTGRTFAPHERVRIGEEARRRNDHRQAVGNQRVVGDAREAVRDDAAVLNELHGCAP